MKRLMFAAAAAACLLSGIAQAGMVTVTPGDPSWGNIPDTGLAVINGDSPRSGNGSIELTGDRSRFTNGNFFSPASNLGLLSDFSGLSFDWKIDPASTRTDYSPALRLHIWDGAQRSELIYEAAYNTAELAAGTGANAGTWVTTNFSDLFYQNKTGFGVTFSPSGAQVNKTLSQWIADNYSASAYVSAISVGAGSGASAGYDAYVDNISVRRSGGTTTYNFEVTAASPTPEPAGWAMMIAGFGGLGALARRRRALTAA